MPDRNSLLSAILLMAVALLCSKNASAQQSLPNRGAEADNRKVFTPTTAKAVAKALKFLSRRQSTDGSFGSGRYRGNVAVTALCGMSFVAAGHSPGRGKYGKIVRGAVKYLLSRTQSDGFISEAEPRYHGPMYGHGFATLFLAEVYGTTGSRSLKAELKKKLKLAVQLIVSVQNKEGGWRYKTDSTDADVSVTVCQVMALRAARNAGLYVPKATIQKSIAYLKQCQNRDGGFRYQTTIRVTSDFPRSAAGVVALYSAGIYKGSPITNGLNYLWRHLPRGGAPRKENHYFYGQYYAVQAMWHAGGKYWREWYPAIRDELLADQQEADGRWNDEYICDEYGTAMACLVLQMPVNYLPIFQR